MRSRREKIVSDRKSLREDPYRIHVENRIGQQSSDNRATWRGRKDIASFYFTRFPEDATEKDLWHHFKKFGDVREGHHLQEQEQERQELDNIVFGGLKMYVNTPKFGRNSSQKTNPEAKRMEYAAPKGEEATRQRHLDPRPSQGVVRGGLGGKEQRSRSNERSR